MAVAVLGIFLLAYVTGLLENTLRPLTNFLPFRGALFALWIAVLLGSLVFAARRSRQAANAEREFRNLFENAPVGVFRSTPDGRFLMVNPALARMLGYASPRKLIESYSDITRQLYVYPQNRTDYLTRLQRDGVIANFENQVFCQDGSIIWILGNARAERDAQGNILYIEGSVQDITARKKTAEAHRRLVEQSLQGIVIHQNDRTVFANRAFSELTGYSVEELLQMDAVQNSRLIHPEDRAMMRQRSEDHLAGKTVPTHYVFQAVRKDGTTRWLETNVSLTEHEGAPAILMLMVDVTERKRAQDKMQENLQRTRMREELSASLARAGNDLNAVLRNLTHAVCGMMGDLCIVTLIEADGEWARPAAYAHANDERMPTLDRLMETARFHVTHPLMQRVLVQGEPVLVSHVDANMQESITSPAYREYIQQHGMSSYVLVPIRHSNRILGSLSVAQECLKRQPNGAAPPAGPGEHAAEGYSLDDQTLLQELADRAALAIANAQLVQQLQTELDARREAEDKYRTLVEQIPAVTYIESAARTGITLFVSPQIESMLGYTPEEWLAVPDSWVRRLHPEDRAWVLLQAEQSRHSQLPFRAEYRLVTRDGGVRWVHDEARFVYSAAREVLYQQGSMIDITAHKILQEQYAQTIQTAEAEREALKRELGTLRRPSPFAEKGAEELDPALLRALVENTVDMLMVMSPEGTILFINPSVIYYSDYELQDVVGQHFSEFTHPEDVPIIAGNIQQLVEKPNVPLEFPPVRTRTKAGEWRYIQSIGVNRLDHPDIRALLFNVRDVTDIVAREQARVQAEAAEREQRAFANALRDVASLLNRASNTENMLDGILDTLGAIVPYETAGIFMLENTSLRAARTRGFEKYGLGEWIQGVAFPATVPKFQMLTQQALPIVIGDTREFETWIDVPETRWIRSHVAAPIRVGDETVGILGVDSATPNFYTEQHGARLMAFADLAAAAMRNAELLHETQQGAQEFRALYETTRDLSAPPESELLLQTIVTRAIELLKAPIGFLFAQEAADASLRLVVSHGLDLPFDEPLPVGSGLAGRVALLRQPLYLNDYSEWEHRIQATAEQQVRAALAVPIAYGGNLIGVLGVADKDPGRQFDERQLSLLTLFAGQAGAALETARLLNETRQRAEQLSLLYDVGLTLNRVLEPRTQLAFLFKIAQRALRTDRMAFFRFDPDRNLLLFEMAVGMPEDLMARMGERTYSIDPPDGLVGWVAQNRVPARVPDVDRDERWLRVENIIKSAMAVPVEHERELRGVLIATSQVLNAFSPQDERLLILFANQIAAAMELSRLFQAQTRRRHELELLREASLAFASVSDRETLTTLILQFALRLVKGNNAFLFFYNPTQDLLEFGGMLWAEESPIKPEHFTPRHGGLTHTVARTGTVIVIDNVNTHPMFSNWKWGGSIASFPLKGGGQVRAVLNVAYEQPHMFAPEELRALELLVDQSAVALENVRQAQETQEQLRHAQLLHRAGGALSRTLSLDAAIEPLADFFMQAVGVEACCITAVNEQTDELRVLLDRDPMPDTRLEPGYFGRLSEQPHVLQSLRQQQTLSYRRDAPDLDDRMKDSMDRYHWCSLLVVPLFAGNKVIGIVELADQHECREFSSQAIRLAESLAHQAASALENARLFQETQRRAEQLTVLNRIARRVNRAGSLDEMLAVIEGETAKVLPSDASYIALYDAETDQVDFHRIVDYGQVRPAFRRRLGPSFTREIITTARALRIDDYTLYASPENPPQYYGDATLLHSWLGVPIRSGDQVLGVISLQSKECAAFREADEQLLQTIADQVAAAIGRALRT